MTINETHLGSPLTTVQDEKRTFRLRVPVVPTLLAALAMVNVTSVVLALME
jgi:hypothetical protein